MTVIRKTFYLFLWMLLGLISGVIIYVCVGDVYSLLKENLPSLFPTYNIVAERELYERSENAVIIISMLLNILTIVYISSRLDNDKLEYIVTKTDGIYKIPDVLKAFVCKFAISDFISSIIVSAAYFIPISFIPAQFMKRGSLAASLALPFKTAYELFGYAGGLILVSLAFLTSHALAVYPSLKYYRAKWLSGFAEG